MDVAHDTDMREIAGESGVARGLHPDWELDRTDTVDEKAQRAAQMKESV
jgi:hypothetical protein